MIKIKSPHEIKLMAEAGQIAELARRACGELVAPGITTRELDNAARKVIEGCGAKPSFLGYGGFPGSICCSINDEVIHGIPGSRKIREGDIVKIDVGAHYMGYHGDCAATFAAGPISEEAQKLIEVTRQSFYEASSTPARATEFPIFPVPLTNILSRTVFTRFGIMWDTASEVRCMRSLKYPTSWHPTAWAEAPGWWRA